jgi:hypothetical protein
MKRNKLFFFLHGNRQNEFESFVGQQHSVTVAWCDGDTLLISPNNGGEKDRKLISLNIFG